MDRGLFPVKVRDFHNADLVEAAGNIGVRLGSHQVAIVAPGFVQIFQMGGPGRPEQEVEIHPVMFPDIVAADFFVK